MAKGKSLDAHVRAPLVNSKRFGDQAALDVSASYDEASKTMCVFIVNRSQTETLPTELVWQNGAPSRLDTEMYRALERTQQKLFPEATTLPSMLTGATDSAQLRAKGVQAYGLGSVSGDGDSARIHGNDERVSVAGLRTFLAGYALARHGALPD